jgi:hypothetical protein
MDPKVMMQVSELIRQLPPDKLQKMQTLMHNMAAGFNVQQEMEEFERSLPPGFREKMMALMAGPAGQQMTAGFGTSSASSAEATPVRPSSPTSSMSEDAGMDLHEARMTILRAVADGRMSPDEAEKLLFTA